VVGFTLDGLGHAPGLQTFGASPEVVHALNDKTLQYRCFRDLGLPVPAFDVVDARLLAARAPALLSDGPVIVQPAYSAGGEQAIVARRPKDLAAPTGGGGGHVVVARFIPGCRTLSGNGIVTRVGDVLTLGVTELLQDGLRFDGFIFPTFEGSDTEARVDAITVRIGEWLREHGYWGFFTADLIRRQDGALFVTEANVRFSGEAAFLDHYVPHNLFGLIASTVVPSNCVRSEMRERIVVTKIRPHAGQIAAPIDGPDEAAFLNGAVDAFRVGYLAEPVRVVSAHFIGLAGVRLPLTTGRDAALKFYERARWPCREEASRHHAAVQ
jgi:biotin carboxylase